MSTALGAQRVGSTYELIKAHRGQYGVQALRRVLDVAPSGYYGWLQQPLANRAQEDARLLRLIRAAFVASHGIYGAPRVFPALREAASTAASRYRDSLDQGTQYSGDEWRRFCRSNHLEPSMTAKATAGTMPWRNPFSVA